MKNNMEKYLILNNDNEHEYTVTVKDDSVFTLITSGSPIWSDGYRNKVILTIEDDGNNVNIDGLSSNKKTQYDEEFALMLLLNIKYKHFYKNRKEGRYTIFKTEDFLTI